MKKSIIKLLSLAMIFMLAFSLMAGCGGGDTKTDDGKTGTPDKTAPARDDVIIATANEPPTMAPHQHNAVAGNYMNILTHNTLFKTNIETLEPEPCLAEKSEVVSDKEWKITLRKGVKFHNGETMTAADVKASMEYARAQSSFTNTYTSFWDKVDIVDDNTLLITTKEVYAKTLYDLSQHYVLPKSLLDSGKDINANPIGTGPYKFVKWTLGDSIEFEAFEDYWEGAPAIKKLTYRIIPEGSSRTIALEAGEIDYIVEVETNDLSRLQADKDIAVINQKGTSFNMMMINNEKPPFNNEDFRHALNCAVDKDALVQVALNGAGTGNFAQTPTVLAGSSDKNLDKYDLTLAKQYLEKSGIDPKTVVFSCICSDDTKRRAGEVIQANLAELGITMNLESMDLATYLSATAEGSYEAAIGGYTSSNMMSFIEGVWTTKSINGSNKTRTSDAEIDRLYNLATTQLDATERNKTLEQCSARINQLCGQVPTYGANVVRAFNANLEGIAVSASNTLYWQYVSWAK
ncbi:MAG: ABC transporter substrate-binding protein [Clostridiaceae bacterium]|nr:ABC transporter substrate-binding protein [Clostridiaceae bacterium]